MRFISYSFKEKISYGIVSDDGIVDLGKYFGKQYPCLKSYIAAKFPNLEPDQKYPIDHSFEEVTLLPPITNSSRIICVAINYFEDSLPDRPVPEFPLLFIRFASSHTGHLSPVIKPVATDKFDFEGELAVIIGKAGHKISREKSMEHVAGYSCYNDGSVRDWQKHSSQFTAGKNFFKSAGFGPWMVSASELTNPTNLSLETRVNGVVKQATNTEKMIFDIPFLINYVSKFTPLEPGDVLVTGTPLGFGSSRKPPEFLKIGDSIDVEIEGVGILSNIVADDLD